MTPADLQDAILAIPCVKRTYSSDGGIDYHDGFEDALNAAAELVAQHVPGWQRRPTCPGIWANIGYYNGGPMATIQKFDQADLDRGAPFYTDWSYGPIQQPPSSTEGRGMKDDLETKLSVYSERTAIDKEIDRFEWKHSWHLPRDSSGYIDWFSQETKDKCREVILKHREYASKMLAECNRLLNDVEWKDAE